MTLTFRRAFVENKKLKSCYKLHMVKIQIDTLKKHGLMLKSLFIQTFKYYLVLLSTTMEAISLKLEETFLEDIEDVMKRHRYTTKTEFIREAIRDKIKELEKEDLLLKARKLYGASKRKTTDEQLHKAGEKAFKELENLK